ncbi:MAG: DUF2095 family protein [Candidatus Kariarchaeaceae archaeon]
MTKKKPAEEILPPPLSFEELEEQFPMLAAEMKNKKDQMMPLRTEVPENLMSVKVSKEKAQTTKKPTKKPTTSKADAKHQEYTLTGFIPKAEDFIQRCSTVKEAEEIISFMEKQEQLDQEQAETLRDRLKTDGLSSFGTRTSGHYERITSRAHERTIFKSKKQKER